ncbi:MAG: hypothetical protein J0H98_08295 [Solirubrobacterales bacterium]|nr:hypothetical protein [Solirubrobacterales bacterium]
MGNQVIVVLTEDEARRHADSIGLTARSAQAKIRAALDMEDLEERVARAIWISESPRHHAADWPEARSRRNTHSHYKTMAFAAIRALSPDGGDS